jgi:hypothetical protein
MSIGTIIAAIAGVGGLGLAGALAFLAATGGLPALAGLLAVVRFFPSPRAIGKFLVSPPGLCVLVALSWVVTFAFGYHRAKEVITARYEQRIADSIKKNDEFDRKLSEETAAKAREQEVAADDRVKAAEQKVAIYEEKFKSCEVGAAADWLNDDGSVPAQPRAITKPPTPPRRP